MGRGEKHPSAAKKKMICKKQKQKPKRQVSPEPKHESKEAQTNMGPSNDEEVSKQALGIRLFGVFLTQSEDVNTDKGTPARKEQKDSVTFVKEPQKIDASEQGQSGSLINQSGPQKEFTGSSEPHAICEPIDLLVQNTEITDDILWSVPAITKIVNLVGYRTSVVNNVLERKVFFMAMRSDGEQLMVDNEYMKACYPLVLIDYYEEYIMGSASATISSNHQV